MIAADQLWPAPAKLNLMLHITGRRADGYHNLQTVFQFLDYGDGLQFSLRADGEIRRLSGNEQITPAQDLALRAARLLQQHTTCPLGVDIAIDKRLPLGGGLGGGSSDAATVLHALNRLWKLDMSSQQLADLGLQLGADVPVFVHGFAAFAEGVGEQLTAIELEQPWYLVITPAISVSTAEIFADPELTRDSPPIKICDLFASSWDNVCTEVAAARYPEIKQALDWLSGYGSARMSGSGASVFAQFDSEVKAQKVRAEFSLSELGDWPAFVARGCNQSPLLRYMNGAKF
jgi:4-diphosphocytidyl-2-C-methyl-D-erythritol kinase